MELNYIIDGLIDGINNIVRHNHDVNNNEIYNDLDKQRELINKLIEFKKQIERDLQTMKVPTDLYNKLLDVLKENADLLKPKLKDLIRYKLL